MWLSLLVYSYIVYLVSHGHCAVVDRAAVVAAQGEVQQYELLTVEGIYSGALATAVDGGGKVYLVEQLAVEIYAYGLLVPVHAPCVELVCPVGIALYEVRVGYLARVPYGLILALAAPGGVGEDVWHSVGVVVLHDVYLAVVRPRQRRAEKPYRRPRTLGDGDAGAYLEPSVAEGVAAAGVYRRGGVFGVWRLLVPAGAVGIVFCARASLAAGLDGEYPVTARRVVALVVLGFVVALETLLKAPAARVGTAVGRELVAPDEAVAFAAVCIGLAARRLRTDVGRE